MTAVFSAKPLESVTAWMYIKHLTYLFHYKSQALVSPALVVVRPSLADRSQCLATVRPKQGPGT